MKKMKVIKPFQKIDVGISCCCMMLEYYGAKYSIVELKNEIDIGRDGIIWDDIKKILANHKMSCYFLNIKDCSSVQLEQLKPFVAKICNEFIIVEKYENGKFNIVDPIKGRYELEYTIFINIVNSEVLVVDTLPGFKKENRKYFFWKFFIQNIFKNKKLVVIVLILSIISYVLNIASPMVLQNVIDNAIANESKELNKYIVIFIASILLGGLVNYIKGDALIKFRLFWDKNISRDTIKKIIFVPYKYYESRNNSEIMYGLGCTGAVREVFATQMINGLIDFGATFFIICYIIQESKYIGIMACVLFVINALFIMITNPQILEANQSYIGEQAAVNGSQLEVVNTIQSIKMSAMEKETYQGWQSLFANFQNKYEVSQKVINSITSLTGIIKTVSPFVILLMAIKLYQNRILTIGEVLSVYSLSNTFFNMANSLFNCYWGFTQSNVYMERIADIVMQDIESFEGKKKINVEGNITFRNVGFSYKEFGEKVLKNITLTIRKGEKIAIVGKSGSGKSTLAKLFVGLYKPTEGEITYEGITHKELDMSYVCSKLGIIAQEATLFNKTIYENIRMNRIEISNEDVINAAKIAGIHDEIQDMPLKYNTIVSDLGNNFSGGQRQRIVLARAIAGNPRLIVMDEATSALDNINESKITNYLRNVGSTQIIIAHRFSSIIDADRIIVMDNGSIVGEGSHAYLMDNNDFYRQLYDGKQVIKNDSDNKEFILDEYKKAQILRENMLEKRKVSKRWKNAFLYGILMFSIVLSTFIGMKKIDELKKDGGQNEIEWYDESVREFVELQLGKTSSKIKVEDLYMIQKITIKDTSIDNLKDLSKFHNLTELELNNVGLSNVNEISGIKTLKKLKLSNNNIEDIQELRNLYQMEILYLDNNRVSNIDVINELNNLEYVNLCGNNISNWDVITRDVQIKKYNYNVGIMFDYERLQADYSGWKIELWNNDIGRREYDFNEDGIVKCLLDTNDSVIAYRIINDNNLSEISHTRYFDISNVGTANIKVCLKENVSEFTVN